MRPRKRARTLDRRPRPRYNGGTLLFMLVETREPFDEGERPSREPWLVALLAWLLPWPALIVWLCATALAAWRGLCALPTEGLNQMRQ